ncbi:hypothetical protein [Enterococcus sp. BWR-S5]|uniref:hypothetical protein n=1 Tax=Enterococcus sp. BWR-S5 TaxID=2787714 RepID=UPI0019239CD4|nr:hypothetical protein [Enterococcus sp. BWR-S5]MBL1224199.1 hypothetical protein [Enterococcus sp. BWR-S5]
MKLTNRHQQVLEALRVKGPSTAREVAEYMHGKGYTPLLERNIAHPRLNELENENLVKVIGKKVDSVTNKEVAVYEII